jgi:hypothetical protein
MPRPHRRGHLPAPLPLSPSKQTFVLAFAMSLKGQQRKFRIASWIRRLKGPDR